jgi:hypothetical protein
MIRQGDILEEVIASRKMELISADGAKRRT